MNPFTRRVSSLLPNQVHFKGIEVDAHLRVKGAPMGTVYAIGDASVVSNVHFRQDIRNNIDAMDRWKRTLSATFWNL